MEGMDDIVRPLTKIPRMGPGERTRYVPNHASFGLFILSDQVRDPTAEVAQDIALLAAANTAPHSADEPENETGLHARVRKGFKVKKNAGVMKVSRNLRVMVEVVNNVEGAALVEHGARGLARQRMLGRAGAAFGDFKPEGGPT
jgi:hypothetical protein